MLRKASLSRANLVGANLSEASLWLVNLSEANRAAWSAPLRHRAMISAQWRHGAARRALRGPLLPGDSPRSRGTRSRGASLPRSTAPE
jgi:Pentapeptide repeats (8 copies)